MTLYMICKCCRYATDIKGNMKQHLRSIKHQQYTIIYNEIETKIGHLPFTDEIKEEIICKNERRRNKSKFRSCIL